MHPIVNVGNDFFIFERKANERFTSAIHLVNKCDYEGSVKLTKQTTWLVPFDVLSVNQVGCKYLYTQYSRPLELVFKVQNRLLFGYKYSMCHYKNMQLCREHIDKIILLFFLLP